MSALVSGWSRNLSSGKPAWQHGMTRNEFLLVFAWLYVLPFVIACLALLVYGLGLGLASMVAAQLMLIHPFLSALGLMVFTGVFLCSLWVGFGSSFPPPRLAAMGRQRNPATDS